MRWLRARWDPSLPRAPKVHVASEDVMPLVLEDLRRRFGHSPGAVEEISPPKYWVDFGGMAVQDEPAISVAASGLVVSMRVHVVEGLARSLERVDRMRELSGVRMRKHHFWMSCLVLTAEQDEALHAALAVVGAEAARMDDDFSAVLRERMGRLQAAGKVVAPEIRARVSKPAH